MRQRATVKYNHSDIRHVGETYRGYHPHGNSVVFHKEDGSLLYWLTTISPYKASRVEFHIGEKIEISYSVKYQDDGGRTWIERVRFIEKEGTDEEC